MRAYIVVDLGFGDAGKGLLTDFLAQHFNSQVVVRYNGGAQAGHNVVTTNGCHHTFSQFGSGTFRPGVKTYLSKHVVIHPGALLVEGDVLAGKGIHDAFARLRVSEQALVITPFHQAANRLREMARGEQRHGSCGVGVGEAVEDALLNANDAVYAGDLRDLPKLRRKLRSVCEMKREQLLTLYQNASHDEMFVAEWNIFANEDIIDRWIDSIARINGLGLIVSDALLERWLRESETAIFEGAQGVLLDADAGFHPHTTWSRCTAENARELLVELAPHSDVYQIGVMRCYAVRHGRGPLPTETSDLSAVISEHNQSNEWQEAVRYGWFDAVLMRYALEVTGKLDALAVTHVDLLSRLKQWRYCAGYKGDHHFEDTLIEADIAGDVLKKFHIPSSLPLEQRAEFTQMLSEVIPMLDACPADERKVLRMIETLLGEKIGIVTRGATAGDVQLLNLLPE